MRNLFGFIIGLLATFILEAQRINFSENLILHELAYTNGTLWAVDYGNGLVLKSLDDGDSWTVGAKLGSEYFEQIQFVSESTGFVCGDYGYIYRTKDGGVTWEEISPEIEGRITEHYRNDSTKNQNPDGQFVSYYHMYFSDSMNGFISGFKMNPKVGGSSFSPLYFITTDGGDSWELRDNEADLPTSAEKVFVNNKFYLTKPEQWTAKKTKDSYLIRKSTDGGETWTDTELPGYKAEEKWMIRKILFMDEGTGFAFGGTLNEEKKALVFFTTDGGKTWIRYDASWPHIHDAILVGDKFFISGKEGFFKEVSIKHFQYPIWNDLKSAGEKYQIDGSFSVSEVTDTTDFQTITNSSFYVVKKSDKFTYIAARSNGFTILNTYLIDADSFKIMHASAALGQVDYWRSGDEFITESDSFQWIYRDPSTWDEKHPDGVDSIEEFYERFGWMANTWTMGSYREYEMLISNQHFTESTKLIVSFSAKKDDQNQVLFYLDGEETSITGDLEGDKLLHNGYLKSPIKLEIQL